ncbi:hypothetical protein SKAU_G00390000 [Synaphobranchus kaupii]|uniref:Uncharacterized protein n=1 Tax=Synaphobranchus kaupii TaxID=118154 RepID=A0A9Q1EBB7_SYNKA|nr:hypothetical protein SKAU_G00390000 [Synaphobranchus kaupii]
MAMTQECPEQHPAPLSGVIARPHQGTLINNVQWVHIPVLVNLTAWSPDLDKHCKGESVTQMYKDLMTTAFLKYHNMVAADFQSDSLTPTPTGRKLLGFLDGVLGATGTGLGISNWMDTLQIKINKLKLKELIATQVLQTDAFLQESLKEEQDTYSIYQHGTQVVVVITSTGKAEALAGSAQSQTTGMRCCSHDGAPGDDDAAVEADRTVPSPLARPPVCETR